MLSVTFDDDNRNCLGSLRIVWDRFLIIIKTTHITHGNNSQQPPNCTHTNHEHYSQQPRTINEHAREYRTFNILKMLRIIQTMQHNSMKHGIKYNENHIVILWKTIQNYNMCCRML